MKRIQRLHRVCLEKEGLLATIEKVLLTHYNREIYFSHPVVQ